MTLYASYTSGPWEDGHNVSHRPTIKAKRLNHCKADNGGFVIAEFFGPDARANAILCASAPDLVTALIVATDALAQFVNDPANPPYDKHCLNVVGYARNIIAEATGIDLCSEQSLEKSAASAAER